MGFWDDVGDFVEGAGNAVASAASAVGDAVEGAVDAVVDGVEKGAEAIGKFAGDAVSSVVEWVSKEGGVVIGTVAGVVGGIVKGVVKAFVDIVHDVADIVRDIVGIIGKLFRLDFAGIIAGIVDLVIHVVDLFIDLVRIFTGGYFVGGVVAELERQALRRFVESLLRERISNPAILGDVRTRLGLEGTSWGLTMQVDHRVFVLDSATTPLWRWHRDGFIDLYALAGLGSLNSFQIQRPRTWVRTVGEGGVDNWYPINRWVLSRYIDRQGRGTRIRVYAMERQAVAEKIRAATEKAAKIGVKLSWNWGESYPFEGRFAALEVRAQDEYRFVLDEQDNYVRRRGLRTGALSEECRLLAFGGFRYQEVEGHEGFGQVGGRSIAEGGDADGCRTPGRTDSCCNLVARTDSSGRPAGSSVMHRDVWPYYVFRFILAHEIGHYLGLCHFGHDGLQNIMFQMRANSMWDVGLLKYYYQSEPEFTLEDGKNAWRFIVDQLACCMSERLECAPGSAIGTVTVS